jgi:hypothetical protein
MAEYDSDHSSANQPDPKPGPFLAKVVSNIDPTYMGVLEVEILHPVGGTSSQGQLHQVKYMSPFFGQTSVVYNGETSNYNNTQKTYGMWAVPPDVGATVIIIFIDGDPKRGFWIGCVPDENMDFMVPGLAATEATVEDPYETSLGDTASRVPVAEYNKEDPANSSPANSTTLKKPRHPFTEVLDAQGLLLDDTRGITTSSARRESPSMVFGISTPGPLDKQDGAQTGNYGKPEHMVTGAPVSRLGGTTFVMDDGDDKFLRKKTPSEGPPEYASLEEGETDGDVTMPHNELFRIRTRTGHQILFHNTEDLIYITNARGTAWIELTSDGKIDIYAQDSISIKTDKDLNLYSGRDINIEAKRNFNVKVHEEMHTHVVKDHILIVDANQKIHVKMDVDKTYDQKYTHHVKQDVNTLFDSDYKHKVGGAFDLNIGGHNFQTSGGNMEVKAANTTISGGNINLNGPEASTASEAAEAVLPQRLKLHKLSIETGEYDEETLPPTIMRRVVTTEPYVYHENVDPVKVKSAETDRDIDGRYEDTDEEQTSDQVDFTETMLTPPELWKTYSTAVDTFARNPPPATNDQIEV